MSSYRIDACAIITHKLAHSPQPASHQGIKIVIASYFVCSICINHNCRQVVEYKTFSSDASQKQAPQQTTQTSQLPPSAPRADNSRAASMTRSVTEMHIPINQQSASRYGSTGSINKPMEPLHVDVTDSQTTQVLQQVQQSPSFSYSGRRSVN